ncbi:MAG: hypothetical protein OES46_19830 [Gammaproteobacteria bacterium]|nr:hypothetical protein [Gammaproteobacteria bacterium]
MAGNIGRDPDTGKIIITRGMAWVITIIIAIASGAFGSFMLPTFVRGISISQAFAIHEENIHTTIDNRLDFLYRWGPETGPRLTSKYKDEHAVRHDVDRRLLVEELSEINERLTRIETTLGVDGRRSGRQ